MLIGKSDIPAKTSRRSRRGENRLDVKAWVDAALAELAIHGIDGVRIEVLAKRLDVTKGSFYWHFKDRDALLVGMLDQWRRGATVALIERLDRKPVSARERLSHLLRIPIKGERSAFAADVELSMRLWGRRDQRAKRALEEVDELRLHYIRNLLQEIGVPQQEVVARATLAYSYMRVAGALIRSDASELMQHCETLLIGVSAPDPGAHR